MKPLLLLLLQKKVNVHTHKSSGSVWWEAARPKTLMASLCPVIVGSVLAYKDGHFKLVPAVLCLLVALVAQIASNFANDYFDYKKGTDRADRLGPKRAVASGWITPKAMLRATLATLTCAACCGALLLYLTQWQLIGVGVAILVGVLAYSAGPFPLAYNGLGDVCVLLFYGIIPVCYTYYVQALSFSDLAFQLSISVGLLSTNILIVNNYRDYAQDKISKKRTTIVLLGKRFGAGLYLLNGIVSIVLLYPLLTHRSWWVYCFLFLFSALFYTTWRKMMRKNGYALNGVLADTARNLCLFTLLLVLLLLCN